MFFLHNNIINQLYNLKLFTAKSLSLMGLLFLINSSIAQDFLADVKKAQAFNTAESMAFEFESLSEIVMNGADSVIVSKGKMMRYQNHFYSLNSQIEMISDGKILVVVNNDQKSVEIFNGKIVEQLLEQQRSALTQLSLGNDSAAFVDSNSSLKHYVLFPNANTFQTVDLYFNATGSLSEMKIHYNVMEGLNEHTTKFLNYRMKLKRSDFTYRLTDYVSISKKRYVLSERYNTYSLINHLLEE